MNWQILGFFSHNLRLPEDWTIDSLIQLVKNIKSVKLVPISKKLKTKTREILAYIYDWIN